MNPLFKRFTATPAMPEDQDSASILPWDGVPSINGLAFSIAWRFISRSIVAYLLVVFTLACPNQLAIVLRSTPDLRRWIAVLCLMLWGWSLFFPRDGRTVAALMEMLCKQVSNAEAGKGLAGMVCKDGHRLPCINPALLEKLTQKAELSRARSGRSALCGLFQRCER